VLGIRPSELLGVEITDSAVGADQVAQLIREHCRSRGISIAQFEEAAGWWVAESLDEPQRLLQDYSLDGIQDICHELGVDWQRLILSLGPRGLTMRCSEPGHHAAVTNRRPSWAGSLGSFGGMGSHMKRCST